MKPQSERIDPIRGAVAGKMIDARIVMIAPPRFVNVL